MLEIVAIIAAILAIAIVIVLIMASTKPATFSVRRSAVLQAPAEAIFPLINNFHQWAKWSPWENKDPAMKRDYSGAESGKGAIYEWEGNAKVGKGRMEVTSIQPAKTSIKLDFLKPFEGHNTADFVLEPQGSATRVTWVMYGPLNFMPGKLTEPCIQAPIDGRQAGRARQVVRFQPSVDAGGSNFSLHTG